MTYMTYNQSYRNKIINLIYDEIISPYEIVLMCFGYMGEEKVIDMLNANDISLEEIDQLCEPK